MATKFKRTDIDFIGEFIVFRTDQESDVKITCCTVMPIASSTLKRAQNHTAKRAENPLVVLLLFAFLLLFSSSFLFVFLFTRVLVLDLIVGRVLALVLKFVLVSVLDHAVHA